MQTILSILWFCFWMMCALRLGLWIFEGLRLLWIWFHNKFIQNPMDPKWSYERSQVAYQETCRHLAPVSPENVKPPEKPKPYIPLSVRTTSRFPPSIKLAPARPDTPIIQKKDDESDFLSTFVAAEIAPSAFDSTPSTDYSAPDASSSDSFSFGGGDSGGGGATGDW